jgi:hypothetical protein
MTISKREKMLLSKAERNTEALIKQLPIAYPDFNEGLDAQTIEGHHLAHIIKHMQFETFYRFAIMATDVLTPSRTIANIRSKLSNVRKYAREHGRKLETFKLAVYESEIYQYQEIESLMTCKEETALPETNFAVITIKKSKMAKSRYAHLADVMTLKNAVPSQDSNEPEQEPDLMKSIDFLP